MSDPKYLAKDLPKLYTALILSYTNKDFEDFRRRKRDLEDCMHEMQCELLFGVLGREPNE